MKRKLLRLASKPPDWQYAMINIRFHLFEILKWYNICCTIGRYSWAAIVFSKYTYYNNKYINYLIKASLKLTHNVFFAETNIFMTATNIKLLSQMINKKLEKVSARLNTITVEDFAVILAFVQFSWAFVWS